MAFKVLKPAGGEVAAAPASPKFRVIKPAAKDEGSVLQPIRDFTDPIKASISSIARGYKTGQDPLLGAKLVGAPLSLLSGITNQVTGPGGRALAKAGLPIYSKTPAPWDDNFGEAPELLQGDDAAQAFKGILDTALSAVSSGPAKAGPPAPKYARPLKPEVRAARAIAKMKELDAQAGPLPVSAPGALPVHRGGENLTAMAEVLAKSPGPGRRIIREGLRDHAAGATKRVKTDIATELGGKGDYFDTLDTLITTRKAEANSGIKAIETTPVKLDENSITALRSDLAKTAIKERIQNALASPDAEVRAQGERLARISDDFRRGKLDISEDGVVGKTSFTYGLPDGGQIVGAVNGKDFRVYNSASGAPGQGEGTRAYADLATRAVRGGGALQSDVEVSASAARVYEKLAEQGFKVEKNPAATPRDGGGFESKGWVYRVTGAPAAALRSDPMAITLRDAQDISRSLQQSASAAYRAGDGGRGEALSGLGKAIRSNAADPARGGVQGYAEWLKKFGDDMDSEAALELGKGIFGKGADAPVVAKQVGDMNDTQRALFQKGVGEALLDRVRGSRGDVGAMRDLLKSEEFGDRVALAFPDDASFSRFMDSAARRVAEQDVSNRLMGGSPTYPLQAARAELEADAAGDAIGVFGDVATLNLGGLTRKGLRKLIESAPKKSRSVIGDPEANLAASKALMSPEEETRLLNLLQIQRIRRAQRLASAGRAAPPLLQTGAALPKEQ
ncbi:hypothetical protein [Phenylobacterium sp.]|uniref:hypothetical protein n=1 Tax=Phenylobacterium sp. TaxID=1871053 RepID=UPI002FC931BC